MEYHCFSLNGDQRELRNVWISDAEAQEMNNQKEKMKITWPILLRMQLFTTKNDAITLAKPALNILSAMSRWRQDDHRHKECRYAAIGNTKVWTSDADMRYDLNLSICSTAKRTSSSQPTEWKDRYGNLPPWVVLLTTARLLYVPSQPSALNHPARRVAWNARKFADDC